MRWSLRNIFRLHGVFLPLFISVLLSCMLFLLSYSLTLSCDNAIEQINEKYKVDITVSHKELNQYVENKNGSYSYKDINNSVVDDSVYNALVSHGELSDIRYEGASYTLNYLNTLSGSDYSDIMADVAAGRNFFGAVASLRIGKKASGTYNYSVRGYSCEETFLSANPDAEITYISDKEFGEGLLLSEAM